MQPVKTKLACQYARLKTDQLCENLMYYARSILRKNKTTLLTWPTDIKIEIKVFELYYKIILHVQSLIEKDTTLERDMELLVSESNFNVKMGIVYRSERKRIVRSQLHLIDKVTALLQRWNSPISKAQFNAQVLDKTD